MLKAKFLPPLSLKYVEDEFRICFGLISCHKRSLLTTVFTPACASLYVVIIVTCNFTFALVFLYRPQLPADQKTSAGGFFLQH